MLPKYTEHRKVYNESLRSHGHGQPLPHHPYIQSIWSEPDSYGVSNLTPVYLCILPSASPGVSATYRASETVTFTNLPKNPFILHSSRSRFSFLDLTHKS